MKKLYYVVTNAYDMVISDDGDIRRALTDNPSCAVCDNRDRAEKFLAEIEDDSSWAEYSETVEELASGDETRIIATCERDDL